MRDKPVGVVAGDGTAGPRRRSSSEGGKASSALRRRERAARMERAAARQARQIGQRAGDRMQRRDRVVEVDERVEQAERVGMMRRARAARRRAGLDEAARVHHREVSQSCRTTARSWLTKTASGCSRARSSSIRSSTCAWTVTSRRGRRLVAEEDARLGRERDRDHDALAHAAGELVWIRARPPRGIGDPTRPSSSTRGPTSGARQPSTRRGTSATCAPTVRTGRAR